VRAYRGNGFYEVTQTDSILYQMGRRQSISLI